MKGKLYTGILGAITLAWSAGAQAILIDNFDGPMQVVTVSLPPSSSDTAGSESGAIAAVLGDHRDVFVVATTTPTGGGDVTVRINKYGMDRMSVNNDSGVGSVVQLAWDGSDGVPTSLGDVNQTGLGGVDLTGGTGMGILVDVLSIDLDVSIDFTIYSGDDGSGNATGVASLTKTVTDPTMDLFFPYADFVASVGSLDQTNAGAVVMTLSSSSDAWDARFALVENSTVPAPATVLLLSTGLPLLRRRLRQELTPA